MWTSALNLVYPHGARYDARPASFIISAAASTAIAIDEHIDPGLLVVAEHGYLDE